MMDFIADFIANFIAEILERMFGAGFGKKNQRRKTSGHPPEPIGDSRLTALPAYRAALCKAGTVLTLSPSTVSYVPLSYFAP